MISSAGTGIARTRRTISSMVDASLKQGMTTLSFISPSSSPLCPVSPASELQVRLDALLLGVGEQIREVAFLAHAALLIAAEGRTGDAAARAVDPDQARLDRLGGA